MSDRYFVDHPISLGRVTLTGPEAHHLMHVMRAGPGTQVTLFDGHGAEFPAVVQQVRRSEVELSVVSCDPVDRELPIELTLGVALPKGDRQKWLIEKAVELGVTQLAPLRTERAVAQPVEQAILRLRRSVIEASKQCGRNRLMQIVAPQNWSDFVRETADVPCRLLAHPQPEIAPMYSGSQENAAGKPARYTAMKTVVAVGPEGGLTDDEVTLALAAGWRLIDLGPRILRIETAALAMVAELHVFPIITRPG